MKLKTLDKPAMITFCSFVGDFQGCGHIRIVFPSLYLNLYKYKGFKFVSIYDSLFKRDADYYRHFTFIKFQRSSTDSQRDKIRELKSMGFNYIYELDDLITGIPEWNYAHDYYEKYSSNIEEMIRSASGMTVSTDKMKEIYSNWNKNIVVIPNRLPKFMWGDIYPKHMNEPREKRPRILWAGSQNHFALPHLRKKGIEGGDFGSELLNFIRKTTDIYEWVLCGACPLELESIKDKITIHPWKSILEYPQFIKSIEPDICIAPLEPGLFNECKCLEGNTKVISTDGIKKIKDVKDGDYIWQENTYKKVDGVIEYKNFDTIKITTKRGYEIEGTYNHKVRCNGVFKRLDCLNIGDTIDLSFFDFSENIEYQKVSAPFFLTKKIDDIDLNDIDERMIPTITINEEWGRFLGFILGDGHLSTTNCVSISCDKQYLDVIEYLVGFGKRIGLSPKLWEKKRSDGYKGYGIDIKISSRNLKWILANKFGFSGRYGKKLYVPDIIWRSPKSVIREFIRGLFESDGTVSKTHSGCSFVTKERQLAKDIQFLLLGFGILTQEVLHYNKKYNKEYYEIALRRQACDLFYENINFISDKKKKRLENIVGKKHSNAFKLWELKDVIKSIEYGNCDVYDVQIDDGHYYTANGILSHNSDIKVLEYLAIGGSSVFSDIEPYKKTYLKAKDDEEMVNLIEKLADDVNFRKNVFNKDFTKYKGQIFWEDNNNVKRYIDDHLMLIGMKLP